MPGIMKPWTETETETRGVPVVLVRRLSAVRNVVEPTTSSIAKMSEITGSYAAFWTNPPLRIRNRGLVVTAKPITKVQSFVAKSEAGHIFPAPPERM